MKESVVTQAAQGHAILIGKRLAVFRKHLGLSQQEVADQIGTTQNLIYRIENDLNSSISMVLHVCHYYRQHHRLNFEWLVNPNSSDTEFAPMVLSPDLNLRKELGLSDRRKLAIVDKFIRDLERLESPRA
jgi:transcriptional regulator with XRE-family HTH domain